MTVTPAKAGAQGFQEAPHCGASCFWAALDSRFCRNDEEAVPGSGFS